MALIENNESPISYNEHLAKFDGLSTTKKLRKLTKEKNLPVDKHTAIWQSKQRYTSILLDELPEDFRLMCVLCSLSAKYTLGCASNSINQTLVKSLKSLGLLKYISHLKSNEDVRHPKPHPEMYMRMMLDADVSPKETVIIEDSHIGRKAAIESGAHVMGVKGPEDVTLQAINEFISLVETGKKMKPKWVDKKLNVIIPMAGAGSRFANAGYTFPKPLIDVRGEPMIKVVVDSLNIDANYIYIVQEEHYSKYNLESVLNLITPNCKIVRVNGFNGGAACHLLTAQPYIDNPAPLLIANSDQYVDWESNEFMYSMQNVDGGILTFENCHPKWSYAKVDDEGYVTEVAEKKPISPHATVGIYYWKHGSDFVSAANAMIAANDKTNGEFYTCPAFNYAIKAGKKIKIFDIPKECMWGLGDPEQLDTYLRDFHK